MSSNDTSEEESSTAAPSTDVDVVDDIPRDEMREDIVATLREFIGDGLIDYHIVADTDIWVRVHVDSWVKTFSSLRIGMDARHFSFVSVIDWLPSPFGRSMDSEVDNVLNAADPHDSDDADEAAPEEMQHGYAGGDSRFQVFGRVQNISDHWGITVKADLDDDAPSAPTLTTVFAGADWHEREAYEMFGVNFEGHPALRKLYLPADFEGNPLRKDFPLLARIVKPWPGNIDVEPFPENDSDDSATDAEAGDS